MKKVAETPARLHMCRDKLLNTAHRGSLNEMSCELFSR